MHLRTAIILVLCSFILVSCKKEVEKHGPQSGMDLDDIALAVTQDDDGQFVIAGKTIAFGSMDAFLLKVDQSGQIAWGHVYGGEGFDEAWAVDKAADGGFFVSGYSRSYNAQDQVQVYLVKTSSNGNELWHRTYDGGGWGWGFGVAAVNDGGCLLAGTAADSASHLIGKVIRVAASGDTVWNRQITIQNIINCLPMAISAINDSEYAIVGEAGSAGFAARISFSGEMIYSPSFGAGPRPVYSSVVPLSRDEVVCVGTHYPISGGSNDFYAVRYTFSTYEWDYHYAPASSGCVRAVAQCPDGDFIAAGWIAPSDTSDADLFVAKFNTALDTLWTRQYEAPGDERAYSIVATSDGGALCVGEGDNHSRTKMLLVRVNAEGDTLWTRAYGGSIFSR